MKKLLLIIIILLPTTPVLGQKMRVAVMDFKPDGVSRPLARKIAELIRVDMMSRATTIPHFLASKAISIPHFYSN